jgi:AcrR family transcriptional regulator
MRELTMSKNNSAQSATLTKDRVIIAAMKLADAGGIEAMSMRKLGRELGVEAMAIYHHFADKNQLIEGMIDYVHGEIDLPSDLKDWRIYMRSRAASAFDVLVRHPWAPPIMETGVSPGPSTLNDSESMIKCFRKAGFSTEMTVHAVSVLNIYIYGAAMQYARLTFSTVEQAAELGESVKQQLPVDAYPYLTEMITQHMMKEKYNPKNEFEFGLNLILDGIASFESKN